MAIDIQQEDVDGTRVLALTGRLDTETSADVELTLQDLMAAGERNFLIDMSGIGYVSSAGLRVLLATAKQLEGGKGSLRLCSLNASVKQVFDVAGFSKLFSIFANRDAALAGMPKVKKAEKPKAEPEAAKPARKAEAAPAPPATPKVEAPPPPKAEAPKPAPPKPAPPPPAPKPEPAKADVVARGCPRAEDCEPVGHQADQRHAASESGRTRATRRRTAWRKTRTGEWRHFAESGACAERSDCRRARIEDNARR